MCQVFRNCNYRRRIILWFAVCSEGDAVLYRLRRWPVKQLLRGGQGEGIYSLCIKLVLLLWSGGWQPLQSPCVLISDTLKPLEQQHLCMCKTDMPTVFPRYFSWKSTHVWANSSQCWQIPTWAAAWLFTDHFCLHKQNLLENVFLLDDFAVAHNFPFFFFACKCSDMTSQRCWWLMCSAPYFLFNLFLDVSFPDCKQHFNRLYRMKGLWEVI